MDPSTLAYGPAEAARLLGVSRSALYREISAGRLVALKAGKRTLITAEEIKRWLSSLPTANAA